MCKEKIQRRESEFGKDYHVCHWAASYQPSPRPEIWWPHSHLSYIGSMLSRITLATEDVLTWPWYQRLLLTLNSAQHILGWMWLWNIITPVTVWMSYLSLSLIWRELKQSFPFPPHPGNTAWQGGSEIWYYDQDLYFNLCGGNKPTDQGDWTSFLGLFEQFCLVCNMNSLNT